MNNKPDMVAHPPHYQSAAGLEVIDVIKAFTADLKGIEATDTGNILKYICRWKHKNGLEDLKKARWYLEHLIDIVEMNEEHADTGDWHPIDKTIECVHESETLHPYGDTQCLKEKKFTMCKGHVNCAEYHPIIK